MMREKINSRGNTAGNNILYLFHARASSRFNPKAGFKHLHSAPLKDLRMLEKLAGEDLQGKFSK